MLQHSKTRRMVVIAILVAMASVLHYFEKFIPVGAIIGAPGARLGLANIITLVSLYFFSFKEVFLLVLLRVMLTSMFGGGINAFLYSIVGGLLSFLVMYIMVHKAGKYFSEIIISVVGSLFHIFGQIIVAGIIIKNWRVIFLMPYFSIAGIATGIGVGLVSKYMIMHMKKILT